MDNYRGQGNQQQYGWYGQPSAQQQAYDVNQAMQQRYLAQQQQQQQQQQSMRIFQHQVGFRQPFTQNTPQLMSSLQDASQNQQQFVPTPPFAPSFVIPAFVQQRNDRGKFTEAVNNSKTWENNKNKSGPFYDYIVTEGANKENGWLRKIANISMQGRSSNSEVLPYYELYKRCYKGKLTNSRPFYDAFNVNRDSIKYILKKKRKAQSQQRSTDNNIHSLVCTPVSKRKTQQPQQPQYSDPFKAMMGPPQSVERRSSPNEASWKPLYRDEVTPHHLKENQQKMRGELRGKTVMDTPQVEHIMRGMTDIAKGIHHNWKGDRCDMEQIVRVVNNLSGTTKVHRTEAINRLRAVNDRYKQVEKVAQRKRHMGTRHTQNYHAAGIAMTPNLSLSGAEFFIAAVNHSLLKQMGLDPTTDSSVNLSAKATCLTKQVANLAASVINRQLNLMIKANYVFLACDKGNRKGVAHFAKILSFYDREEKRTHTFIIDIDPAGSSDKLASEAIKHSMVQKEVLEHKKLSGQCTDNGGGGTLESFYREMKNIGITTEPYFIANCTLHNLSLAIAVPVEKVLGLGALDKVNCLQMMHSIYDVMNYFGIEVWNTMMKDAMAEIEMDGDPPTKMPQPVTTRWWWLGIAASYVHKYWKVYKRIANNCIAAYPSGRYANKVASSICSLMKEESFFGQVLLIMCYSKYLINPYFDFLQSKGLRSKTAGFNSESVLVCFFLIVQSYESVIDGGWKTHEAFKLLNDHLSQTRWMSYEEEKAHEMKSGKDRGFLKEFETNKKITTKMKKTLEKLLTKNQETQRKMDAIIQKHTKTYCTDLEAIKPNDLSPIMMMFQLETKKNVVSEAGKTSTKVKSRDEKIEDLKQFEPIDEDKFHVWHMAIATRRMKLEWDLEQIKQKMNKELVKLCDIAEDGVDHRKFKTHYKYLFETTDYTSHDVETKLTELKAEINASNGRIEVMEQHLSEQPELPEGEIDTEQDNDNDENNINEISNGIDEENNNNDNNDNVNTNLPPLSAEEIDANYKDELERQTNLFLEMGHRAITEHFKRWANELLIFGIAAEPPIASIIASRIIGQELKHHHTTYLFESTIHKCNIDLNEFIDFIETFNDESSLQEIRNTSYYHTHAEGLKRIADGEKLWDNEEPTVVELRTFIEDVVLGIASNQQFVELAIKDTEHVTVLKRSVAMKSILAITRAHINQSKSRIVEEKIKNHSFQANQHTTGGVKGERIMKAKSKDQDIASRTIVRGSFRSKAYLNVVTDINKSELPGDEERIKRLSTSLMDQGKNNEKLLKESIVNNYNKRKKRTKKMNQVQMRQKPMKTDATTGCITYTGLQSTHIQAVYSEIAARGGTVSNTTNGIRKQTDNLRNLVLAKDGKQYEKSFHPRTNAFSTFFPWSIKLS